MNPSWTLVNFRVVKCLKSCMTDISVCWIRLGEFINYLTMAKLSENKNYLTKVNKNKRIQKRSYFRWTRTNSNLIFVNDKNLLFWWRNFWMTPFHEKISLNLKNSLKPRQLNYGQHLKQFIYNSQKTDIDVWSKSRNILFRDRAFPSPQRFPPCNALTARYQNMIHEISIAATFHPTHLKAIHNLLTIPKSAEKNFSPLQFGWVSKHKYSELWSAEHG